MSAPGQDAGATRKEVAEYIVSMLEGLRSLAQGTELTFLAYLIGIAIEEARDEKSRRDRPQA